MAQRRMFSKSITTSDLFVDMPTSTQLLYFHLGMEADDEGFVGNAKMLSRAYGANNDDLKLLTAKGFIIPFPSGVTVIKDWQINNQIRKDRRKPTIYSDEKSALTTDINGSYCLDNQVTTSGRPNDNQMTTKCPHRLGEVSIGEVSIGQDRSASSYDSDENENREELVDAGYAAVVNFYQNNISPISPLIGEKLNDLINDYGFELVLKALEKAVEANARDKFKYANKILSTWYEQNIKTLDDVLAEEKEFERKKEVKQHAKSGGSNETIDWSNKTGW